MLLKKLPLFLLHFSFVIILAGALCTFIWGERGYIHLREGVSMNEFLLENGNHSVTLPFEIKLDRFEIIYYKGTQSPADYVSHIEIRDGDHRSEHLVSMNNILSYQGYRFYQASFDEDLKGSILSVNHDPYGIAITYTGYILLGLSMIWMLISKQSGFRKILRSAFLRQGCCIILFLSLSGIIQAKPTTLTKEEAAEFGKRQLFYGGRIAPLQTFARDFTSKIYGKPSYKEFSAEQVVAGWIFYPQEWRHEPMIEIKNSQIGKNIGIDKKRAAFSDFFNPDKTNKLAGYRYQLFQKGGDDKMLRDVNELYEKIQLIEVLMSGDLLDFVPVENEALLSPAKLEAELWYNKLNVNVVLYRLNLILGICAFFYFGWNLITGRCKRWIEYLFFTLLIPVFGFLSLNLGLRWYISEHIPLSNGYETMMFIAWSVLLIAILMRRNFFLITASGFTISGFALLVSSLAEMNPQITFLVPVLSSPWLSIHVSLVMISYTLFVFMMLNGIIAVILLLIGNNRLKGKMMEHVRSLQIISRLFLYPAVFLLAAGIFTGSVWANVSWGRYWSWDPKEVWALITMIVYALAFHNKQLKWFNNPLFFHIYSIIAFSFVLMTYFGVNYYFSGMHSYQ